MEIYSDEDITLWPLDVSDADDFVQWHSNENLGEFCLFDQFTLKEAATEFVVTNMVSNPWQKAICLYGRVVGCVSMTLCDAEIGYVVASEWWGKGIATRTVRMAANAAFVEWGNLERLEAVVDVENLASQWVGFQREGLLWKYLLPAQREVTGRCNVQPPLH